VLCCAVPRVDFPQELGWAPCVFLYPHGTGMQDLELWTKTFQIIWKFFACTKLDFQLYKISTRVKKELP
jgi:hypothetical protein